VSEPVLPDRLLRIKARLLMAAVPLDVRIVRTVCGHLTSEGAAVQLARFDGDTQRCLDDYWEHLDVSAKMESTR
jgi:hypothetical protein